MLPGSLFVHCKGGLSMAMTTKMLLVAIVFYGLIFAAVVAVIVWAVKYLIRYGIDYYFKKLAESRKPKED